MVWSGAVLLCEVRGFTALHPASERPSVRAETRVDASADDQNQLHDEVTETSSDLTASQLIGHPASFLFKAALLNILMSTKDQTTARPVADEVDPSARDGRLAAQWDVCSKWAGSAGSGSHSRRLENKTEPVRRWTCSGVTAAPSQSGPSSTRVCAGNISKRNVRSVCVSLFHRLQESSLVTAASQ